MQADRQRENQEGMHVGTFTDSQAGKQASEASKHAGSEAGRQTVSRCCDSVASMKPIPQDPDMTTSSVTHTRGDLSRPNTELDF